MKRAAEDLRARDFELTADPPLTRDAVFHAQQAAEKALKGFLSRHDSPFRKTHSIAEIGGACLLIDSSLEETVRRASPLTEYAWRYRYPGEDEDPSPTEAREALLTARAHFQEIGSRLPAEMRA